MHYKGEEEEDFLTKTRSIATVTEYPLIPSSLTNSENLREGGVGTEELTGDRRVTCLRVPARKEVLWGVPCGAC